MYNAKQLLHIIICRNKNPEMTMYIYVLMNQATDETIFTKQRKSKK